MAHGCSLHTDSAFLSPNLHNEIAMHVNSLHIIIITDGFIYKYHPTIQKLYDRTKKIQIVIQPFV